MARSTGSNKTGAQCHQQKWRHAQVEWLAPSNLLENLSFKDFSMGTATNSSEFTELEFFKKHPAMLIDLNYLKWHRSERHWKTRRTCVLPTSHPPEKETLATKKQKLCTWVVYISGENRCKFPAVEKTSKNEAERWVYDAKRGKKLMRIAHWRHGCVAKWCYCSRL